MAIPNAQPIRFTARGLCDAYDATDKFPGACQELINLVFDQANPELVVSRPGVLTLAQFAAAGFNTPTFISLQKAVGSRIYGFVATARNAGKDEPFCYDTATSAFVTISGVTNATTPVSPGTSGDWEPPTLDTIGTMIVLTHPGFDFAGGHAFGVIDVTTPATPAWTAPQTVTNALPARPQAVANFNNRAYFAVGNRLFFTDVLTNPLTITNATQQLTVGDSAIINALAGLPVQTTSSGVIQALTVFKAVSQIWQVTGDQALFNLFLNYVSLNIGTNAPRSIAQAPSGLYFTATGGPYFLDLLGTVRPLTHSMNELEPDLQTPFQNAINPTRWAGAYAGSVYRICGQTVVKNISGFNDYWFDEKKRRWTGPHTFSYDCATAVGSFFVLSSANNPGQLVKSQPRQDTTTIYTDLDSQVNFTLLSSTFPKQDWMTMKQVVESQIELAATGGNITYDIQAQDDQGNILGEVQIALTSVGKLWGAFTWGDGTLWATSNLWGGGAIWGPAAAIYGTINFYGDGSVYANTFGSGILWGAGLGGIPHTFPVPWTAPLVFEKMQLQVKGQASANVSIGTFYAKYQKTGYMTFG